MYHRTIVHGTIVEGAVKAENDIRVDGVIKGSLHCKAKVIVGTTGQIEGEIRCVNAVIEGSFDGTLTVAESLNVRETAKITTSPWCSQTQGSMSSSDGPPPSNTAVPPTMVSRSLLAGTCSSIRFFSWLRMNVGLLSWEL